ncbi:MAG TPA: CPBP family intramembrane metalloprotease, partial [Dehalococcoidia bacterium]|nr:CPBP family intramembrane metalloprotease [Dehalococcoidia bacterium]
FSMTHLDIGVIIPIFGIGIIFSMIFTRQKSLWAPIGIHALFNTIGFLAMFLSEL